MKILTLALAATLTLAVAPLISSASAQEAAPVAETSASPEAPAAPTAPAWRMMPMESSLTFSGKQMDSPFSGTFKTFTADIFFDDANLAGSKAIVAVDLGSVESNDAERDSNLKGHEFFNVAEFPQARFETNAITKLTDGSYMADGNLTIGAITAPLQLPFTLEVTKDAKGTENALMKGTTTINRAGWNVGTGDWKDPSIIANDVRVDVIVAAVKDPSAGKDAAQPPAAQ